MVNQELVSATGKISRKTLIEIVLYVFIFGLFMAGISTLISKYFHPSGNPIIQEFLTHQTSAFIFYFAYVVLASVIVPIPTLPVDVVLFNLLDPWIVITVRLVGGLTGGTISFYLARFYGKPLLKRLMSAKNYTFIENLAGRITWQQFLVITVIPVINAEIMAYVGGISKLRLRFTLAVLTGAIFYRLLFVFFVVHAR